jgi:hypothetical protein
LLFLSRRFGTHHRFGLFSLTAGIRVGSNEWVEGILALRNCEQSNATIIGGSKQHKESA